MKKWQKVFLGIGLVVVSFMFAFGCFVQGAAYVLSTQKIFVNRSTFELQTAVQTPRGQMVFDNNQEFVAVPKDLLDTLGVELRHDEESDCYYYVVTEEK